MLVLVLVGLLWVTMGRSDKKSDLTSDNSSSQSDYYLPKASDSDSISVDEMKIERVVVTKLLEISEAGGDWGGESIVQRTQTFMVRILTGPYKGVEAEMQLDLTDITGTGKGVIVAKEGDRLLGYFVMDYNTYTLYGTCTGFQRDIPLMWLALGFIVLLILSKRNDIADTVLKTLVFNRHDGLLCCGRCLCGCLRGSRCCL